MKDGADILVIGEDALRQGLRLGDSHNRSDDEQDGNAQFDDDRKRCMKHFGPFDEL
jgi:hypothetical protein